MPFFVDGQTRAKELAFFLGLDVKKFLLFARRARAWRGRRGPDSQVSCQRGQFFHTVVATIHSCAHSHTTTTGCVSSITSWSLSAVRGLEFCAQVWMRKTLGNRLTRWKTRSHASRHVRVWGVCGLTDTISQCVALAPHEHGVLCTSHAT